jgi:hypothetical protein
VFGHLLMHGGVWWWAGQPAKLRGELAEVLDDLAGWPLIESRAVLDRAVRALSSELVEAHTRYPGLDGRRAFLDKTQYDAVNWLTGELGRLEHPDPAGLATAVVFGVDHLAPRGMSPAPGMGLRVTPPESVRQAVGWLVRADLGSGWWADDLAGLRHLYLTAAVRAEAVLVGSAYTRPTQH